MKKIVITLLSLVITLLVLAGALYFYTMQAGKQSLLQLARDGNFCGKTIEQLNDIAAGNKPEQSEKTADNATSSSQDDCQDGMDYATSYLGTEFGLSQSRIQWCMGVDEIAHYKLSFGNGLKTMLTDMMYISCGDPLQDQPVGSEDE